MHERIKELATKAMLEHCVSHVRLEAFANLIIQECVRVCQQRAKEIFADSKKEGDIFEYMSHGADDAAEMIETHFGLKE